MRSFHEYFRSHNSRFERECYDEEIDWIKQFFHFNSNDFDHLIGESKLTDLKEVKEDEMYLRQKVIDVGGYMVPKTLAPILRTLLGKHGDLGGKTILTSGIKSVTAIILCAVMDKIK